MAPLWITASACAASVCLASEEPTRPILPFPGILVGEHSGAVELVVEERITAALTLHDRVVLQGLPWSAGLDLQLERVPDPLGSGALHLNGTAVADLASETSSFWSGTVIGEEGSDVFLAWGVGATWGWVKTASELVHVISRPAPDGAWSEGTTLLVSESGLHEWGLRFSPRCETLETFAAISSATSVGPGTVPARQSAPSVPRLRYGTLALETDWQYYQLFGDLAIARGYVAALLAAASTRFRGQVDTVLETRYVGFHGHPDDPWQSQDSGGDCFALLYEFQAAWSQGGAPIDAALHHFLSGVDLGCGVAFIDALCDADESFSLTSRLNGLTPFPVVAGPLNWDFVWMCHELGHNFGSPHTHQYCPPLDECSPAGYWGPCQDEVACTTEGTLMSYCHACPGGMANFTTWFHPVVASTLRATVEASCFRPVH